MDGMVSIVSKNQGWITVSPKNMNRKFPIEKQASLAGDSTKTSILTPSWMKIDYSQAPQKDPLRATVQLNGLRAENNRTILTDKDQPQKSVFQIGAFRHNVTFKHQTEEYKPKVMEP